MHLPRSLTLSGSLAVVLLFCGLRCDRDRVTFEECTLRYESEIFYKSPTNSNITIQPTQPTDIRGLYVAEPEGLVIDNYTGEINVSESEAGQQYRIRFISLNNENFCETNVVISGIDYPDGVYNLSQPDQTVVPPFYNANTRNRPPQNSEYDTPPTQIPSAAQQGLIVNSTGEIDLAASIATGQFNSIKNTTDPKEITLYYRVNDQTSRALNRIRLNVYYFESGDRIPARLLEELKRKQEYPRGGRVSKTSNHQPPDIIVKDR